MIRFAFALTLLATPLHAAVEIQDVTSPGGLKAWLVEERSIPFTALELRFRGGTNLDPDGKRGAVNLMTALLEEGAGDLDAEGFTIATEALAADFSYDAYSDSIAISARFLTENRDEAVELLRLAIAEPRFDEAAIERVRGQVLAGIAQDATDPDELVSSAFRELTFGDHPYGSSQDGSAESVADLSRDDLIAAHQSVLARDRVFVGAVGDIDADTLGALLDRLLGDLPEEGATYPERVDPELTAGVTIVAFDTPQSVIHFGQGGIDREDPDFFPAFVMMEVLGGRGFNSRLMSEVREKRGLTYGIGAYMADRDFAETIEGRVATVNARAGETIAVIRDEWRKLADAGLTDEELSRAKTYLTGAYPLRFDGNERIANILAGMQIDGMPLDYIRTRNDKVNAVTAEDVRRVAADLIRPDELRFVVVGRPEGIDPAN